MREVSANNRARLEPEVSSHLCCWDGGLWKALFSLSKTLSPRPACAYAFAKSSPTSRTWHVL